MVLKEIERIKNSAPDVDIGFSPVACGVGMPALQPAEQSPERAATAIILVTRHTRLMTLQNYTEAAFEQVLCDTKERSRNVMAGIIKLLKDNEVAYRLPQAAQTDETGLRAPFSYKFGAVNAGLGWIGKNGVLVSKRFGPRVRLDAVIAVLPAAKAGEASGPVTQSSCPPECVACVAACPYQALKNKLWQYDTRREELIDYRLCNQKRSAMLRLKNRKSACGLCMVSCPMGIKAGC